MVTFNAETWTLTERNGNIHKIWPQVFWYLAPTVTSPDATTHPLDLAMTLHNARLNEGLCTALDDLLLGITPKSLKSGQAKAAEELFEAIREAEFPQRPSRLRCYFLSLDEAAARERAQMWGWTARRRVRCYLVLSQGRYHYADLRDYEQAARHAPTPELARSYWSDYVPENIPVGVTEVLADSALYFPDWVTFPTLDVNQLARWDASRRR